MRSPEGRWSGQPSQAQRHHCVIWTDRHLATPGPPAEQRRRAAITGTAVLYRCGRRQTRQIAAMLSQQPRVFVGLPRVNLEAMLAEWLGVLFQGAAERWQGREGWSRWRVIVFLLAATALSTVLALIAYTEVL